MSTTTAFDLPWRATCGVCGADWKASMKCDDDPSVPHSFCPACQERGLIAPGVLNWRKSVKASNNVTG